jgi:hypothetical protein
MASMQAEFRATLTESPFTLTGVLSPENRKTP